MSPLRSHPPITGSSQSTLQAPVLQFLAASGSLSSNNISFVPDRFFYFYYLLKIHPSYPP